MIWGNFLVCFFTWRCVYGDFGHEDSSLNLMSNWDFANNFGSSNWRCAGCTLEHYTADYYTGSTSGLVKDRDASTDTAKGRYLSPKTGTYYYFSMFIKILDDDPANPSGTFPISLKRKFKFSDGSLDFDKIGEIKFARKTNEWLHVGGDFKTPDEATDFVELYVVDIPPGVRFLLDSASLVEIVADPNWEANADLCIENTRKNDITLIGTVPAHMDPSRVEIKVSQTSHEFGFGTAVDPGVITESGYFNDNYRQFVFDNYEWAEIGNGIKWKQMENNQGVLKYAEADEAVNLLLQKNMKFRAHNIIWDAESHNPDWVKTLTGQDMVDAVNSRIDFVVDHFKGRIDQWNVCNGRLAGNFYEDATNNQDFLLDVFQRVAAIDPDVKLFTNEFNTLRKPGRSTADHGNLARYLLHNNASLHGMGIKSHQKTVPVPMEVLQKRLDILSNVDLPIWITELSVNTADVSLRASFLEDVMRLYFSQPNIDGIIAWHFSDQVGSSPDSSLADGDDLVLNEAGEAWNNLVNVDWTTTHVHTPLSDQLDHTFSGFHGNYKIKTYYDCALVCEQVFTLPKGQDTEVQVEMQE